MRYDWSRYHPQGYECSPVGDVRFSAAGARLLDGRTIEAAYRSELASQKLRGCDWRLGKGRRALSPGVSLWDPYLALWTQWAAENPALMLDLAKRARYGILTDRFAVTGISPARALAHLLDEQHALSGSVSALAADTPPARRGSVVRARAAQGLAPARGKR